MTKSESDPPDAGAPARQRIAKLMARAGLCSRREAEAWVLAGRVIVGGETLTSPAVDVSPEDTILVDGNPLPQAEKTRLFLFHKPRGLVTTDRDPEGRETVIDFLRENWPEGPRVVTIGRLDINTEGLLLLTNDGGLARVLELPQTGWLRRYRVRAKGTADPAALDALADGVTIDGVAYAGIEAKLDRVQGANTWLTMGLREGKNREIKRVLEHLGLEVNRLIRLSFGPFQLLDLPDGAVEEVSTRILRDQLGAALASQAGVDFGTPPAPNPPRDEPRVKRPTDRPKRPADSRPSRPRRDEREEPPPKRERPAAGSRKHVSTLRAERLETSRSGPRTRHERSETRDRRDRAVQVERLVSTRPKRSEETERRSRRPEGEAAGRGRDARPAGDRTARASDQRTRHKDGRRASPEGRPRFSDKPRHGSPPAAGKREGDAAGRGRDTHSAKDRSANSSEQRTHHRDDRRAESDRRPRSPDRPKHSDGRKHGSPSAAGKRERIARSGGVRSRDERTEDSRSPQRPRGKTQNRSASRPDHTPGRPSAKGPRQGGKPGGKPPAPGARPPRSGGARRGPSKTKR